MLRFMLHGSVAAIARRFGTLVDRAKRRDRGPGVVGAVVAPAFVPLDEEERDLIRSVDPKHRTRMARALEGRRRLRPQARLLSPQHARSLRVCCDAASTAGELYSAWCDAASATTATASAEAEADNVMAQFVELADETDFEVATSDFVEDAATNSDRPPALPHAGESGHRYVPDLLVEYLLRNPWSSQDRMKITGHLWSESY